MPSFTLGGGTGFVNAVRRTLLSDIGMWAPYQVLMKENTSCHTDEYIAHRIGLIPFRKSGNGDTMNLLAEGPCIVHASDVTGPAFSAVKENIEVVQLLEGQNIDMVIHFNFKIASVHARYCPVSGVGMRRLDGEGRHSLSFESLDGSDEKKILLLALDTLDSRIDSALLQLANQPSVPPNSMC